MKPNNTEVVENALKEFDKIDFVAHHSIENNSTDIYNLNMFNQIVYKTKQNYWHWLIVDGLSHAFFIHINQIHTQNTHMQWHFSIYENLLETHMF